MFPSGRAGVGLLVLRLTLALHLCLQGASVLRLALADGAAADVTGLELRGLLQLLCGGFVGLGFLTPLTPMVAAAVELFRFATQLSGDVMAPLLGRAGQATLLQAAVAVGLALVGPGAYSIDARISGRREIVIPVRRQSPTAAPRL